jgi:hypothetical protein
MEIVLYVPDEHEAGVYAQAFGVWHTVHDLALDFGVLLPEEQSDPDDPASPPFTPARLVARVRIPASVAST